MAVPLAGQQDPMSLLRALTEQMMAPLQEADFSGAESYVQRLQQQAQGLRTQFNEQLTAPGPDTTQSNYLQRILAGSGDALTGGNQLGATNERLEQTDTERKQQRLQNLKLLADSYEQAAKRAGEAGDMVEEQKLRAKIESTNKNTDKLKAVMDGAQAMLKHQEAGADRAAENERSIRNADTQRDVATIYATMRSNGKLDALERDDPVKAALFKNLLDRAANAAKQRDDFASQVDKKGKLISVTDKGKKKIRELDAEYEAYLKRAQDVVAKAAPVEPAAAPPPESASNVEVRLGNPEETLKRTINLAQAAARLGYTEAQIIEEFNTDPQFKQAEIRLPQLLIAFRRAKTTSTPSPSGIAAPRSN